MKQYKAVAGPRNVNVGRGYTQQAFNLFAEIINKEAQRGWNYHSMETVSVTEKPGCLRKAVSSDYYMLIFYKETSGTATAPSVTGRRVTFTGNIVEMSKAKVGDTVRFGSYRQDNSAGKREEAIEWLVLDKQNGKLLLLSKDALDAMPYNEEKEEVTWATCTLRSWLNGTFYKTAFSAVEQKQIATVRVENEDISYCKIEGENDTEDKVFLLSVGDLLYYFDPDPGAYDPARRVKVTEYAKAQGGKYSVRDDYAGNGWWWLRSAGAFCDHAAVVYSIGYVDIWGHNVDNRAYVVRPALWLNPEL